MPMLYVPIDVATTPMTGHAWVNYWWSYDPEKGLMWWATSVNMTDVSAQCNPNKDIVDLTVSNRPGCIAIQVPVVYEAHAVQELRSQRDQKRMFDTLSKDWTSS